MSTYVDDFVADHGPDDANITSHDTYTHGVPYATFDRLRTDDPVHWTDEEDGSGFWSILRYDDCMQVSRDYETFTSAKGIRLEEMDDEETEARRTLMEMDPPEHTRLRRHLTKEFTRRMVLGYEAPIRELAVEVIEDALPLGEFDFVEQIAKELPMRMLGRMLGTSDADGHQLVEWGDAMLGNTDPEFTDYPVDLTDTEEWRLIPFRSPVTLDVFRYAQAQASDRRECPRDDLISRLLEPTKDGTYFTDAEFNNFFSLLISAGNDTTRYSMTHGMWSMMQHPTLWEAWTADPSITDSAIEELLRTSTVTMHFRRTATRDIEMRGKQITAGDKVVIWYTSANFDPDRFEHPYRYDLLREKNDHMTFGRNGPHLCLGAWLARMELQVVFEELMKRRVTLEQTGPVERMRSNFMAGIKHLPVKVV